MFFVVVLVFPFAFGLNTPCGQIEGRLADGYVAYEGIPFGVQSRFQHSKVAPCWGNFVFQATQLGPACYQGSPAVQGMSEDCLNLNIYVPINTTSLLPVLFYVYGGGNVEGTNAQMGAPGIMSVTLNCVVVVPNYRLGTLGFLVNTHLQMTGNYAIGDILNALLFVRPLLSSFHGDVSRITLMGQSSGGTNIFALLASPRSKGLFRAAISMSGSPNITADVTSTDYLHRKYLLPRIGCHYTDANCLLNATPQNLTAASDSLMGPSPHSFNPPNLPLGPSGNGLMGLVIVDGVVVVKPVLDALSIPLVPNVDLLIQSCQCELDPADTHADYLPNGTQLQQWLASYLQSQGWPKATSMAQSIVGAYAQHLKTSVELAFESWIADLGVTCGNDALAAAAASGKGGKVYRSHLLAPPSHPFLLLKRYAFHTWDYPTAGVGFWDAFEPQESDLKLGSRIRDVWRGMLNGNLTGFKLGGCTEIQVNGTLSTRCSSETRCQLLQRLGFDAKYWWVN